MGSMFVLRYEEVAFARTSSMLVALLYDSIALSRNNTMLMAITQHLNIVKTTHTYKQ